MTRGHCFSSSTSRRHHTPSARHRRLRCRPSVIRCVSSPPSFAARCLRWSPPLSFAARRHTQPHRTSIRTPPPSPLPPWRHSLRVVSAVVRCTLPPPSFATRRQPSPPTPVNQKNTPSTATFVRQCADVSPLSTMMAKARWATMMATARRATTTMVTARRVMTWQDMMATTIATGDNDNDDGDGVTGDGATGDDDDDDCDKRRRRQQRWRRRDGQRSRR